MSAEATHTTAPAAATAADSHTNSAPVGDKGKGKAVDEVDDPMDEDEVEDDDDEEEEEEEEEEDEDIGEPEEVDPSLIISTPRRRPQVNYASKEALEKAGLTPENAAEDEDADEFEGGGN